MNRADRAAIGTRPSTPVAFWSLVFLLFIVYVAPQAIFPALEPLRLAKLSAGIAALAYLVSALFAKQPLFLQSHEIKFVLGFAGLAVLSIPFSEWPGGSLDFFLSTYSKSLVIFFLIANLLVNEERCRQLLWAISGFSAFNAVMAVNRYMNGEFYAFQRVRGGYSGISNDPNDLAFSLVVSIPFMWFVFESSRRPVCKILGATMLSVAVPGVVVTFSRGGFLGLLALFVWFSCMRARRKGASVFVKALILVAMALVMFPAGYTDRIASIIDSSKDHTGSASLRSTVMLQALKIAVSHPLGAGLKMHNLLLQEAGAGWAGVHSVFLEIAADLGIVGGALFGLIFWKLIRAMQRLRKSNALKETVVGRLAEALQASLIAFGVSGMFLPVAYHASFYVIAGIAIAIYEIGKRESLIALDGAYLLARARPQSTLSDGKIWFERSVWPGTPHNRNSLKG